MKKLTISILLLFSFYLIVKAQPCNLIANGNFQNLPVAHLFNPTFNSCTDPLCNFTVNGNNTPDVMQGSIVYTLPDDIAAQCISVNVMGTTGQSPSSLTIPSPPLSGSGETVATNKFVRLSAGVKDGFTDAITFRLIKPTKTGCHYTLNFAYLSGCSKGMRIGLSVNPPCPTSPLLGPNISVGGTTTACNDGSSFITGSSTSFAGGGLTWANAVFGWTANNNYNYVTIYADPQDASYKYPGGTRIVPTDFYIDNVSFTENCPNQLTVTPSVTTKCIGGIIDIAYTFKATGSVGSVTATPQINLPNGITFSNQNDFPNGNPITFTMPNNGTVTKHLILNVPKTVPLGTGVSINLNVSNANICGTNGQLSVPIAFTLDGEDPAFTYQQEDCPSTKLVLTPKVINSQFKHIWEIYDLQGNFIQKSTAPIFITQNLTPAFYTIKHSVTNGCWTTCSEQKIEVMTCCDPFTSQCCPNPVVIGCPPNGTVKFSSYNFKSPYTADCIAVAGQVILDQDIDFVNCNFYMEPGAELIVPTGFNVKFEGCTLQGCNTMWKGIKVDDGGFLRFIGSTIVDAHWAIKSESTAMSIEKSTFGNNYYGLYLNNYAALAAFLVNNNFIGGALAPLYIGQDKSVLQTGNISYCGIYATNSIFKVGNDNDPSNVNTFQGLQNGIIARDGYLFAYHCNLQNMVGTPGPYYFQEGILMANCSGEVKFNNLDHCPKGINAVGGTTYLDISDNFLDNCFEYAIAISNKQDSRISIERNVNQTSGNNTQRFAIGLYDVTGDPGVSNAFTRVSFNSVTTGNGYSDGIRAIRCNSRLYSLIYSNHIAPFSGTQETGRGIYLNDSELFQIDSNVVFGQYDGIVFEQSGANLVRKNEVRTNILTGGIDKFDGIQANESDLNTYCCNTIEDKNNALHFTGVCIRDNGINTTQMNNYDTGIHYDALTFTGPQENTGNSFGKGNIDALHDDSDKFVVDASKYTCDLSQMPVTVVSVSPDWFKDNPGVTSCDNSKTCDGLTWFKGNFIDTLIVRRKIQAPKERATQWQGERYLFCQLSENPDIRNNNSLFAQFYEENINSEIGKLYAIEQTIATTALTNTFGEEIRSVEEKIQAMKVEVNALEQAKINADPKQKDAIDKEIAAANATVKTMLSQWILMQNNLKEAHKEKWNNIAKLNDGISTKRVQGQTTQRVNSLLSSYHLQDLNLTETQTQELYAIALHCPLNYGSAVFVARGLYETVQNTIVNWKKIEQCEKGGSIPVGSKVSKNTASATIYPNPASDILYINILDDKNFEGVAKIYNLQGQLMQSQSIQNFNSLNISTLIGGVYFLHIEKDGVRIQFEKISILK